MSKGHGAAGRKARLLLLNSALYIGGAESVTASLCRGLDRDRFDVCVAHLKTRGQIGDALVRDGYEVVDLGAEDPNVPDYFSTWRLWRFIRERKFDIVHSNDLHASIDAAICRLFMPRLRHVNTFHYGNYPRNNPRYHRMEKILSRIPDRLIAVGRAQRDSIRDTYGLKDISVVHNGVGLDDGKPDDSLKERIQGSGEVVIGSVSTLTEQKAIDRLLEAASILDKQGIPFRLVVAGEGPLRPKLEALAKDLGLSDRVEFFGWVEEAPKRVLPWIDIFVQSSLWEAMSIVVLEAMARGLPVVATTVGENPYVVKDGETGYLVEPNKPVELADGLKSLIEDPRLRDAFGCKGREEVISHYSAQAMCRKYEDLYTAVLADETKRILPFSVRQRSN